MFHISAQKHRLWVLVRTVSCTEAVLTSTHNLYFEVLSRNKKKISEFLSEIFQFLVVEIFIIF